MSDYAKDTHLVFLKPLLEKDMMFSSDMDFSKDVRFTLKEDGFNAAMARSLLALDRFLDIGRIKERSTANTLTWAKEMDPFEKRSPKPPTMILLLKGVTGRSSLTGISHINIGDIEVDKKTPVLIKVTDDVSLGGNTVNGSHLDEYVINGLGPYGKSDVGPSVFKVLDEVFQNMAGEVRLKAQKKLFEIMAKCIRNATVFSKEDLTEINSNINPEESNRIAMMLQQLTRFTYLNSILEITRRLRFRDSKGHKEEAKTLSSFNGHTICCSEIMLDCWTKVLRLLQKGELTIEEAFGKDAPYGLPTGENLRGQNDELLKKKYLILNHKYMSVFYPDETAFADGNGLEAFPSMEEIHQRCVLATTNVNETSNKICTTPVAIKKMDRRSDAIQVSRFSFDDEPLPKCTGTPPATTESPELASDNEYSSDDMGTPGSPYSAAIHKYITPQKVLASKRARSVSPDISEDYSENTTPTRIQQDRAAKHTPMKRLGSLINY